MLVFAIGLDPCFMLDEGLMVMPAASSARFHCDGHGHGAGRIPVDANGFRMDLQVGAVDRA